ncbi:hypothetical protein LguiB_005708 [Lonicera macranthoides]
MFKSVLSSIARNSKWDYQFDIEEYIAFEHCYGTLNENFDVYSFGILALEILMGTKRLVIVVIWSLWTT